MSNTSTTAHRHIDDDDNGMTMIIYWKPAGVSL